VGWGTPLTASCLGNFHRVTEVLLAAGVDSTIGSNPLRISAERNYPICAEICMKYGVKVPPPVLSSVCRICHNGVSSCIGANRGRERH
jgi:hypothetical protein